MTNNIFTEVITSRGNEWKTLIEFARTSLSDKSLSDRQLIKLCMSEAGVDETITLIKYLYADSKERPIGASGIEMFFRVVDNSTFSLTAWINAVSFFSKWLESNNRKTSFLKMLGYLQCCEESPENKEISFEFNDLIEDMLKEHGYVG